MTNKDLSNAFLEIIFDDCKAIRDNYYHKDFIIGDYDNFLVWNRSNMSEVFTAQIIDDKIEIEIYEDVDIKKIKEQYKLELSEINKGKKILLYWIMDILSRGKEE